MKKAGRGEALESIDARLDEIERKLDRLRALYESFFLGVERTPPNTPRRELNRLILELQQTPIGNASFRFRFQSLSQKWVLLTTYWNRTLREIEAGTYRRDLAKAHRQLAARGGAITEEEALRMGIPGSRVKAFVERQNRLAAGRAGATGAGAGQDAATQPPAAAAPTPVVDLPSPPPGEGSGPQRRAPAPPSGSRKTPLPGVGDAEFDAFYKRYVDAHVQAVGVRPKVSPDQLREKLGRDLPKILGDKSYRRVELEAVVEGGKVRLRARPVR